MWAKSGGCPFCGHLGSAHSGKQVAPLWSDPAGLFLSLRVLAAYGNGAGWGRRLLGLVLAHRWGGGAGRQSCSQPQEFHLSPCRSSGCQERHMANSSVCQRAGGKAPRFWRHPPPRRGGSLKALHCSSSTSRGEFREAVLGAPALPHRKGSLGYPVPCCPLASCPSFWPEAACGAPSCQPIAQEQSAWQCPCWCSFGASF